MNWVGVYRRTPPICRILVRMMHVSPRKSVVFSINILLLCSKIEKKGNVLVQLSHGKAPPCAGLAAPCL